jgi:hypothetical protein
MDLTRLDRDLAAAAEDMTLSSSSNQQGASQYVVSLCRGSMEVRGASVDDRYREPRSDLGDDLALIIRNFDVALRVVLHQLSANLSDIELRWSTSHEVASLDALSR